MSWKNSRARRDSNPNLLDPYLPVTPSPLPGSVRDLGERQDVAISAQQSSVPGVVVRPKSGQDTSGLPLARRDRTSRASP